MACLPRPDVVFPEIPDPFSLTLSTPPIELDVTLCCRILQLSIPPQALPLSIPPEITQAISAALAYADATIQAYLDLIPLECPRE